jgi:hypothetical protein
MASLWSYLSSQMFTPRSVLFWDVTQYRLVVSYQLVSEPPINPIFKGQLDCWPLKMGQTGRPKTPVTNYLSTMQNHPEEWRSHLHHGWSLITMFTHILFLVLVMHRLKVRYGHFFSDSWTFQLSGKHTIFWPCLRFKCWTTYKLSW